MIACLAAFLAVWAMPLRASTWVVEPLYTRLPQNCFAGMVQVSGIRKGAPRPEAIDTLSATVTQVLRNVCGEPEQGPDLPGPDARIVPGRKLEFLRPKEAYRPPSLPTA